MTRTKAFLNVQSMFRWRERDVVEGSDMTLAAYLTYTELSHLMLLLADDCDACLDIFLDTPFCPLGRSLTEFCLAFFNEFFELSLCCIR